MRALVIGLAETGVAVTRRLRADGWDVTVVEDTPGGSDSYSERVDAVRALGAHLEAAPGPAAIAAAVGAADLVVPSPLVRIDHPALVAAGAAGVPVRSEIDLAGERATVPIVAITGTNGKTTVTTLTAAMLAASGCRVVAAGNLGRPLIDAIDDAVAVIVAEVSSFQLACSETFHPKVAVVLAITPDHLDWHGGYEPYVEAKARITRLQTADDVVIFDADDRDATAIAAGSRAQALGFSRRRDASSFARELDGRLVNADGEAIANIDDMRRALAHDRTNALAAGLAAIAAGATTAGVRAALASYETLPHRVALVGKAGGVNWYDDSKATNPDATSRALESFDSVVLLAGGRNKGLDLSVLARAESRLRGVVAFGEAGPDVAQAFSGSVPTETVASMREAVRAAAQLAQPGDAVLLSPACASFDVYANYADRGDDFAAEVAKLMVEGYHVTALAPRVRLPRLTRSPFRRARMEIVRRHKALPRPPTYVVLCATVGVLNIVGLVMILSASSVAALSDYGSSWYFFDRQFVWAVMGAAVFIVASSIDYHVWKRLAPLLFVLSVAGLLVVLIPGVGIMVDGSRRWLGVGTFRVQPSELAKLALLCCAANVLARRADRLDDWRQWFPVLLMLGGLGGLVMLEPDLDSVIVLALIGFALLIVGGVRRLHLARLAAMGFGLVTILVFAAPYRRARMLAFLHPWEDQRRTGYQIAQSLIALGSGGVNGVGLGAGRAKWLFLPNAHTDFIFAVIGEELGLIGCLLVLALFAGLGLVGFRAAQRAPDRFGVLLAAGVTAWIVGQAVINLGAVVGMLPVSGITLPFLSAGGSSLVITMLSAGILANVARKSPPRKAPPRKAPARRTLAKT